MRRQVSGRPGSALSTSPGNTNSDGTKAHRNSCRAACLVCSVLLRRPFVISLEKQKYEQKANLLDWSSSGVRALRHELHRFHAVFEIVLLSKNWFSLSDFRLALQIVLMLIINSWIIFPSSGNWSQSTSLWCLPCAQFPKNQLFCDLCLFIWVR